MMDSSFTDDVYDTWLGSMVASELWYPLWDASQITQTANTLIQLITGNDSSLSNNSSIQTPTTTTITTPSKVSEIPKQIKEADYEAAWSLLSKPAFATLPSTLSTMLEELGINSASDLSLLDDEVIKAFLPNLMKPIQRNKLREALGYQ